ncbi:hypothetical protein QJQ45_012641 [Haematococcus lacustris]|nr:hypothetical protein QJQ45_012641 [Haematococcus lacustris]
MKSAAGVEVQQVQLFTQPPSTPPLPRMPAPPPLPALQAPAAASASAAQEDPWASLQSAYRIDDTPRVSPSRPGLQDPLPGLRGGLGSTPGGRTPSRAVGLAGCRQGSASKPTAADALLLNDDDDDLMQHQPLYGGQRVQARRAGAPPSNGAKQGGWGKGEMAQAGTLMVGDAELLPLGPAAAAGVQQGSSHDFVRGMTSNELTDADMDELMGTSQQPTSKPVTCNEVVSRAGVPNPGTQLLPTLVLPLQSGIIAPGAAALQLQGLVLLDLPPGPLESLPSGMASVLGWTWPLPSDDAFAAPRPRRAPPPPSFDWSLDPLDSCSNHTATWATHPVTAATRTNGALGPDAAPATISSRPGGEGAKPAAGAAGGAEWAAASVTLADCVLVLPDDEVAYWAAWLWPSALSDRMDWPSQQAEQAARQWLTRARGSAGGSQAAGEGWGCPPAAPGLRSWLQQLGMGLPRTHLYRPRAQRPSPPTPSTLNVTPGSLTGEGAAVVAAVPTRVVILRSDARALFPELDGRDSPQVMQGHTLVVGSPLLPPPVRPPCLDLANLSLGRLVRTDDAVLQLHSLLLTNAAPYTKGRRSVWRGSMLMSHPWLRACGQLSSMLWGLRVPEPLLTNHKLFNSDLLLFNVAVLVPPEEARLLRYVSEGGSISPVAIDLADQPAFMEVYPLTTPATLAYNQVRAPWPPISQTLVDSKPMLLTGLPPESSAQGVRPPEATQRLTVGAYPPNGLDPLGKALPFRMTVLSSLNEGPTVQPGSAADIMSLLEVTVTKPANGDPAAGGSGATVIELRDLCDLFFDISARPATSVEAGSAGPQPVIIKRAVVVQGQVMDRTPDSIPNRVLNMSGSYNTVATSLPPGYLSQPMTPTKVLSSLGPGQVPSLPGAWFSLRYLTLLDLPLGPEDQFPLSMSALMAWTWQLASWAAAPVLVIANCTLVLAPDEIAYWAASLAPYVPQSMQQSQGEGQGQGQSQSQGQGKGKGRGQGQAGPQVLLLNVSLQTPDRQQQQLEQEQQVVQGKVERVPWMCRRGKALQPGTAQPLPLLLLLAALCDHDTPHSLLATPVFRRLTRAAFRSAATSAAVMAASRGMGRENNSREAVQGACTQVLMLTGDATADEDLQGLVLGGDWVLACSSSSPQGCSLDLGQLPPGALTLDPNASLTLLGLTLVNAQPPVSQLLHLQGAYQPDHCQGLDLGGPTTVPPLNPSTSLSPSGSSVPTSRQANQPTFFLPPTTSPGATPAHQDRVSSNSSRDSSGQGASIPGGSMCCTGAARPWLGTQGLLLLGAPLWALGGACRRPEQLLLRRCTLLLHELELEALVQAATTGTAKHGLPSATAMALTPLTLQPTVSCVAGLC